MRKKSFLIWILLLAIALPAANAQERVTTINYNPFVQAASKALQHEAARKTLPLLYLPFFEDFTDYGLFPDASKWVDNEVYINNTMGVSPVSRGVATFDALNQYGVPYDTLDNNDFEYADSLTSQLIDLSINQPGDSIYLSFFYQPAGNGFNPLPQDSLMLFMRNNVGDWRMVWGVPGDALQPFQQVMVPVVATDLFYSGFQFRFVNIAAFNNSDAVWNVDYIRMGASRNMYDTLLNNVGFTTDPTFLLNDYTYMPYRQFLANPAGERATQYTDSIRDNYTSSQTVTYGFTAREAITNTPLYTAATAATTLPSYQQQQLSYNAYTNTVPMGGSYDEVIFENKYFIQSISPNDSADNDTIVRQQVFDNYLAYDDGTAEKSYYLNLFPSLPGEIAIEYHLNQPDTMRGLAIYFGRQVPLAYYKYFSIAVYKTLAGVNGSNSDQVLYQQDLYLPSYVDTVNHFWIYTLDTPIALSAGTFYAGTIQPAASGSDSLYIGLDVNRIGTNHVYYNVLDQWQPSQISGALMMRPLLGQEVWGTGVVNVAAQKQQWTVIPNPAENQLKFGFNSDKQVNCRITDMLGRTVIKANIKNGEAVDISGLEPGIYIVDLFFDGVATTPQKIIKE